MVVLHRNSNKKPGAETYFICMLIGLFLGFVFLQMPGMNAEIPREEAVSFVGMFQHSETHHQKGHIHSITLHFSDIEKQSIHQVCATTALAEKLSALPDHTEMQLLVHPESNYILELQANGELLLEFDRSQQLLSNNAAGFFFLGIGLIIIGVICGVKLIILEIKLYRK